MKPFPRRRAEAAFSALYDFCFKIERYLGNLSKHSPASSFTDYYEFRFLGATREKSTLYFKCFKR